MPPPAGQITKQLEALRRGDRRAEAILAELVYEDLHARARQYMRRERADHTLQPTALVNETFLKLLRHESIEWQDRAHFLAVACVVMRRILVDHARGRRAGKRSGGKQQVPLDDRAASEQPHLDRILIVDEALNRLSEMDPRQGRLVELMYFGGLTAEEAAEATGVSVRTVKRDWSSARAWLQSQLRRSSA
uniref:RNA polymerase, sigma-24 subunit, ECF subfamily n=1 Tax=Solibacter usitatus (strain Ellin6076) TaxID=234267 RepID=Q01QI6_SOLUE